MNKQIKPYILVADDDSDIVSLMQVQFQCWGHRTLGVTCREQLIHQLEKEIPSLLVLDLHFGEYDGIAVLRDVLNSHPQLPVVLLTGNGSIATAVAAIKLGALDYVVKPPNWQSLKMSLSQILEKQERNQPDVNKQRVKSRHGVKTIIGNSSTLKTLQAQIARIAVTQATVLIQGESGTGKELVAHALHDQSHRSSKPFIAVNMSALPRELVESTLFGHEKGAFTGACQMRIGCCEAAQGGTLFLDEISEMDLDIQAKLLRFLQERTIQRVGSSSTMELDVRVVSATNRDIHDCVRQGRFREDLYYRLNVVPLEVPPLRERLDDVQQLAQLFLKRAALRYQKGELKLADDTLLAMRQYTWPGNVRQLENTIERLAILAQSNVISRAELPLEITSFTTLLSIHDYPSNSSEADFGNLDFDDVERRAILQALHVTQGNVRSAAKCLGLGLATVYRKIKRYGVTPRDYLGITAEAAS